MEWRVLWEGTRILKHFVGYYWEEKGTVLITIWEDVYWWIHWRVRWLLRGKQAKEDINEGEESKQ